MANRSSAYQPLNRSTGFKMKHARRYVRGTDVFVQRVVDMSAGRKRNQWRRVDTFEVVGLGETELK